jgi:GDP-mannose 6-dehydrogenase
VKIAIFGLGYVGVVSAACLARDGHDVLGVDLNAVKTELVNRGKSPIVERGLEELIEASVSSGRLRAGADHAEAVRHAELMLVCVGTPGAANGSLDLRHVQRVCEQIGEVLAGIDEFKTIAIRSTLRAHRSAWPASRSHRREWTEIPRAGDAAEPVHIPQ